MEVYLFLAKYLSIGAYHGFWCKGQCSRKGFLSGVNNKELIQLSQVVAVLRNETDLVMQFLPQLPVNRIDNGGLKWSSYYFS